jgi:hypothetical protein
LDNGRQVAISCEFLATMDAMEEVSRKKKISYARVDGCCTHNSHLKEAERLRYQRGDAPVVLFNVVEGISLHEGETNNGGNDVPRCQSTMICGGPLSKLTKSMDGVIATGSLHRFIGSSLKTPLIAVSRKFSFGSWNQWAISKEILLRILRKYFLPFKKKSA